MWFKLKYCYNEHEEVTINFVFMISKLKQITSTQRDEILDWID